MTAPTVTTSLLHRLIDSPAEEPVLYIDPDTGALDVWARAYVHHEQIVISREELTNVLGEAPTNDDLADYLAELQSELERNELDEASGQFD